MAHIYADEPAEGLLDIHAALIELRKSGAITNPEVRRAVVAEITAGALLDIAYSLRPLGREAADALAARTFAADDDEPDAAAQDFVVVGDLVVMVGGDEPGEVLSFGVDQDATYALVRFAESGDERRVWLDQLERIVGDEPPADLVPTVLAALNAEADGEPDFDPAFDENDFDGYVAPTALDLLDGKAKKKGKKS